MDLKRPQSHCNGPIMDTMLEFMVRVMSTFRSAVVISGTLFKVVFSGQRNFISYSTDQAWRLWKD